MVTLLLDSTRLEVALSKVERALSFRKGNVLIERSTIKKVQLTEDAWMWLRGVPDPGTHLWGIAAMGTWKSAGGTDFALIRRHRAGVVIDLEGHDEFDRVILTTRHGLALVQALQLDGEAELAEVTEIAATAPVPVQPEGGAGPKPGGKKKKPRPAPSPAPAT
ncbi:hypothetical protein [Microbacterium sp.]|uniref:hypothetical protein n=1 Tax=Microbacterium sp. TaxID=51671 RepID=UPI002D7763FC|nr:hypothetical protein [Microbacterium sp.]HET6300626.1 hypothetical protein [Microbacterium sp.]